MLDAEVWTRITDALPSTAVTLDAAQEDSTALRAELARAEKQERALTQAIRRTASSTALDAADIDAVVAEQTEQREVLRERIANIKAQIGDANEREALRRQAISAHETAKFSQDHRRRNSAQDSRRVRYEVRGSLRQGSEGRRLPLVRRSTRVPER